MPPIVSWNQVWVCVCIKYIFKAGAVVDFCGYYYCFLATWHKRYDGYELNDAILLRRRESLKLIFPVIREFYIARKTRSKAPKAPFVERGGRPKDWKGWFLTMDSDSGESWLRSRPSGATQP